MRPLFLPFLLIPLAGCGFSVDEQRAIDAAPSAGWRDVSVVDSHKIYPHGAGGCSDGEAAAFDILGMGPSGGCELGTVCCGAVTDCTIKD